MTTTETRLLLSEYDSAPVTSVSVELWHDLQRFTQEETVTQAVEALRRHAEEEATLTECDYGAGRERASTLNYRDWCYREAKKATPGTQDFFFAVARRLLAGEGAHDRELGGEILAGLTRSGLFDPAKE